MIWALLYVPETSAKYSILAISVAGFVARVLWYCRLVNLKQRGRRTCRVLPALLQSRPNFPAPTSAVMESVDGYARTADIAEGMYLQLICSDRLAEIIICKPQELSGNGRCGSVTSGY